MSVPDHIKGIAAATAASVLPRLRFENSILVMSHMRSVSTALTHVLAMHPEIWGYGETHVSYTDERAPGRLWLNLLRHQHSGIGRRMILDKVLHNDLDRAVTPAFYRARAVFLLRSPAPAIRSIQALSVAQGLADWQSPDQAAQYYLMRITRLMHHWNHFPPEQRIGMLSENLMRDPEAAMVRLSQFLPVSHPLENRYVAEGRAARHGAGDPTRSQDLTRIEPTDADVGLSLPVGVDRKLAAQCVQAYLTASDLMDLAEHALDDRG